MLNSSSANASNVLATWTGSWAAVFVFAAIFNIVAAVMALLCCGDATPGHDIGCAKSTPPRYRVRNGRLVRITLLLSRQ